MFYYILVSLLQAIGKIIQVHILKHMPQSVETSKPGFDFYIIKDARFKKVRLACVMSHQTFTKASINRKKQVTNTLSCNDEKIVLVEPWMSPKDKKGCVLKIVFYYTQNFFIKGHSELYDLMNFGF